MDQEILDKINKRLEEHEKVYCRYQGPKGPKGDKGDPGPVGPPGPAGRDGRDGADGRIVVGQVVGGHFAAATVRVDDDAQIIDLVVPRGPEGPQGLRGERVPLAPKEFPVETEAMGKILLFPARVVKQVRKASVVCKENVDREEKLVRKVRKVCPVRKVPPVLMVKTDGAACRTTGK